MAFPLAKSVAIKDACDHFGNIFGANLNRKDTIAFAPDAQLIDRVAKRKELVENAKQPANV
jgi:hypothetical protein